MLLNICTSIFICKLSTTNWVVICLHVFFPHVLAWKGVSCFKSLMWATDFFDRKAVQIYIPHPPLHPRFQILKFSSPLSWQKHRLRKHKECAREGTVKVFIYWKKTGHRSYNKPFQACVTGLMPSSCCCTPQFTSTMSPHTSFFNSEERRLQK